MTDMTLQNDILREIFNVGVGQAASMLSEITERKIILSVPSVEISNMDDDTQERDSFIPPVINGTLMVSSVSFGEKLTGKANLIFPADKMRTFINLCTKNGENTNSSGMNFTDIDFDVIKEIGNIILNCIMGGLGEHLDIPFNYALPEVEVFDRIDFAENIRDNGFTHVLILYVTFLVDETEIQGAIVIDLSLNSLIGLMERLTEIGDRLYE
ncbi:MAG: chemotaxis protein CheC [Eubacteriales bacterium]|nr:chemotaxis protein CheC [Eubacteriales bacterium]